MTGNHGAQVWLGQCQVVYRHQAGQPDAQRYSVQVAVWCKNPEGFARSVDIHMADIGLALLHTGEPLPKEQWLAQHQGEATPGADAEARQLANKVERHGNTALGYLYAIKAGTAAATQSYLHIETLDNIEPLDGQFDVHPPKTVPDKLYEPLFGQPEPTGQEIEQYGGKDQVPPMKLYAILDAAKVKVPSLRSMLDTADLDFACLITGEDYEALKDSAPYIVELKEDNDFTRTLFTYNPNFSDKHLTVHLWHKEPGIYIRSRASLMELGQHFAQFVRVQDEQGKRYFFRFWDPHIVNTLYPKLNEPDAQQILDKHIIISVCAGQMVTYQTILLINKHIDVRPFYLANAYVQYLVDAHTQKVSQKITSDIRRLTGLEEKITKSIVQSSVGFCRKHKLLHQDSLFGYAYLAANLGKDFLARYPAMHKIADIKQPEYIRKSFIHHLTSRLPREKTL